MAKEPPAWVGVLTVLLALAATAWGLWCTIVAFTGGTMPLIGYEVEQGSAAGGLFMLFIGTPALTALARLVCMMVLLPLAAVTARKP